MSAGGSGRCCSGIWLLAHHAALGWLLFWVRCVVSLVLMLLEKAVHEPMNNHVDFCNFSFTGAESLCNASAQDGSCRNLI